MALKSMALRTVSGPTSEPVTLAEAKAHLRVDLDEDDIYISTLITAARQTAETWIGRALMTQTYDLVLDRWPVGPFVLPRAPLQSVTSITYIDDAGATGTVSASNYIVDTASQPGRVKLKSSASWPAVTLQDIGGVTIRFVAGYGNAMAVPQAIKHGILMLVGTMYESREDVLVGSGMTAQELPVSAKRLLLPYRIWEP